MSTAITSADAILDELREARSRLLQSADGGPVWRDEPVSLDEFVRSERYCNLPHPLTPEQRKAAIEVLGEDPKKMFDREEGTHVSIAVLLWGKGSGKDYTTSILQLYCIYVILCLEEPQLYFDQAPDEPLDVINVAYNAEQAKNVYFVKFLARLKRCVWFREHFDLIQSGRLLEKRKADSWGEVIIGASSVVFPGNIRAISESSENESYEGYNIIVWIMDEASAFKSTKKIENARGIYGTLKSSANTRFIGRWKGFVLSYPRSEDEWDFTTQLYKDSLTDSAMYGSRKYSWEVAPETTYPGGFFTFTHQRENEIISIQVPEVLREEFEKYPEESLGKYCCTPGRSQGAFFELVGSIPRAFSDKPPVFVTEEIIVEKWDKGELLFRGVGHNIVDWNVQSFSDKFQYVIHVDGGLTGDSAALAMAHGEPILIEVQSKDGRREKLWTHKVVEDAHVVWVPDKKRSLRVSIRNIETVISQIADKVPISVVTYDRWNSAGSIESLAMMGIVAKEHNINRDDYDLLKSVIYAGDIELIRDPLTEFELSQLRRAEGGKVDHPEGGSKDLADSLAGVTRLILKDTKTLKKARGRDVGMPRPTAAYGHTGSADFGVGDANSGTRIHKSAARVERIPMPDVPPLPFGIGSAGRPRPKTRGLPGGQTYSSSLSDPLIGARIRELSR